MSGSNEALVDGRVKALPINLETPTGVTEDGLEWFGSLSKDRMYYLRILRVDDKHMKRSMKTAQRSMATVVQIFLLRSRQRPEKPTLSEAKLVASEISTEPAIVPVFDSGTTLGESSADAVLVFEDSITHGEIWMNQTAVHRLIVGAGYIGQVSTPKDLPINESVVRRMTGIVSSSHYQFLKRLAARINYHSLYPTVSGFWSKVGGAKGSGPAGMVFVNISTGKLYMLPARVLTIPSACDCIVKGLAKLANPDEKFKLFFERETKSHAQLGKYPVSMTDNLRIKGELPEDGKNIYIHTIYDVVQNCVYKKNRGAAASLIDLRNVWQ